MRRVPRLRHLLGIELYRRWVLLEGRTWTIPAAVGLATLLTVAGLGLMMLTGQPALVILPILGFLYPFVRMRSRALKLQAQVQSTLPDLAALLAAEMTASNPPDKALERCAEFEGPLSRIIQIAVQEARVTGRPLFGKSSDVAGVLLEVAARYELPALRAFTAQVDMAARTGGNGAALMTGLARTLITEYKDRALREAEALDSRLAVPSVGFFFMPFLFLILVPLLLPVLNAL
jgi:Flp pilus assembly protein TadB